METSELLNSANTVMELYMASYSLRPHWTVPKHERTEQFGYHDIARKPVFQKTVAMATR